MSRTIATFTVSIIADSNNPDVVEGLATEFDERFIEGSLAMKMEENFYFLGVLDAHVVVKRAPKKRKGSGLKDAARAALDEFMQYADEDESTRAAFNNLARLCGKRPMAPISNH